MTVLAFNDLGESSFQAQGIVAKTSSEYMHFVFNSQVITV